MVSSVGGGDCDNYVFCCYCDSLLQLVINRIDRKPKRYEQDAFLSPHALLGLFLFFLFQKMVIVLVLGLGFVSVYNVFTFLYLKLLSSFIQLLLSYVLFLQSQIYWCEIQLLLLLLLWLMYVCMWLLLYIHVSFFFVWSRYICFRRPPLLLPLPLILLPPSPPFPSFPPRSN